jgi:hypothetical protein
MKGLKGAHVSVVFSKAAQRAGGPKVKEQRCASARGMRGEGRGPASGAALHG